MMQPLLYEQKTIRGPWHSKIAGYISGHKSTFSLSEVFVAPNMTGAFVQQVQKKNNKGAVGL